MIQEILLALSCGRGTCPCAASVRRGQGLVHCVAHEDPTPSLNVTPGKSVDVVVRCHGGCDQKVVVAALEERGLWNRTLVNTGVPFEPQTRREVARYEYETRDGQPAFTVIRYEPKGFSQRGPNGAPNMDGVERVLYRLPAVIKAVESGEPVFIVEGERDADSLAAIGICGTTSPQGAGKWSDSFAADLSNADVTVIADADDPGRKHAREVATSCALVARSVKLVEMPSGKDVTEWLDLGGDKTSLLALVAKTPEWNADGRRILTGRDLSAMYDEVVARRMAGDPEFVGIATGLSLSLDQQIAYRSGDLMLVVAATGVGKSSLLQTMQLDLDRRKIPSMFVSLEMSWIVIVDRLIAAGMMGDELRDRPGMLVDEPSLTVEKLEVLARAAKVRGALVLFVDYAQRMASEGTSEYERVSFVSNELARIARAVRICIVAAAQVSRHGASRDGKPPALSDIRSSGHLEQDAAVVLSLGRKTGEAETTVAILKNRHGGTGQDRLYFDGQRATFTAMPRTSMNRAESTTGRVREAEPMEIPL